MEAGLVQFLVIGDVLNYPKLNILEKEMVTHSRILAWRIPWTEEPGGLPSMGSHRVGHEWSDLAAAAANLTFKDFSVYDVAVR